MNKILQIGWKDFRLIFRDRSALILMLLAPFVITLGMGAVTGQFSRGGGGLTGVPVVIFNQDEGILGEALVAVFSADNLEGLFAPVNATDVEAARKQVDDNQVSAAVIIPAGFSESILSAGAGGNGEVKQIEVYTNPARPVSAGVVQSTVEGFLSQVETRRISSVVAVSKMVAAGLVAPKDASQVGQAIGMRAENGVDASGTLINVERITGKPEAEREINYLSFLAPGMALTFLMYTVSLGGRSIIAERRNGTLARLLSTPTSASQVLGGKIFGIYLIGAAQMGVLVGATTLLFGLSWGDPLGIALLVLAAAAGATGWGLIIASLARSPAQVSSMGMAVMLLFGLLGGNLVFGLPLPEWVKTIGKLTPNAWGQAGFDLLARGGGLAELTSTLLALVVMGVVLFAVAVALFRKNGVLEH